MIITCVPVSMKSTRCQNKAIAELYHKPLIYRLTERIQEASPEEVVWCLTNLSIDHELEEMAIQEDIPTTRSDPGWVAAQFLAAAEMYDAEHIVRVTGDNPLTDPKLIDDMIKQHLETDSDYTHCLGAPKGTKPEIIRTEALRYLYSYEDPAASEYMTYQLMTLERKSVYHWTPDRRDVRLTVDTPDDLERVQAIYEDYKGFPPGIEELIQWYDRRINDTSNSPDCRVSV